MTPVHLDLTAYQSMKLLEEIAADLSLREEAPASPATRER
jgi:hypothetical protein